MFTQSNSGDFRLAAQWLRDSERIVFFTGAGVSAESGIPTFRDADGLWQEFPPHEFGSWRGLLRTARTEPRRLARFLSAVLEPIANAVPNQAHRAVESLEQHRSVTVVTQNIDGLHQEAGSTTVWEVHGTLLETVTMKGKFLKLLSRAQLKQIVSSLKRAETAWLPLARILLAIRSLGGMGLRGLYRPNLVLFGDELAEPAWTKAVEAVDTCDLLVMIGTSGQVFPAALLPDRARKQGAKILGIDPAPTNAELWLPGLAGEVLPRLVELAFADW